jgi:hypothetical protein
MVKKGDSVMDTDLNSIQVLGLRERVLKALVEARTIQPPSLPEEAQEAPKSLTPQQKAVGIVTALWKLLFGAAYAPQGGAVAKLITAYGGFSGHGPERLAVQMIRLAWRDIPGGPLEVLFQEAKKAKAAPQPRMDEDRTEWYQQARAQIAAAGKRTWGDE